jgi:transposase
MKPYSIDLRIRVIEAYNRKEGSIRGLAKRFAVHWRTVANWLRRFAQEQSVGPRQQRHGPLPRLDEEGLEVLEQLRESQKDATRAELGHKLEARTGIRLSPSSVGRALERMGVTRKKRRPQPAKPISPRSGRPTPSLPNRSATSR